MLTKVALYVFMLTMLAGIAHAAELTETAVLDGKVTLLSPKNFGLMSAEMLALKYPSANRPTQVLSNASGTVNLAFNHSPNKVPADANFIQNMLSEGLHTIFAEAQWLNEGVQKVNDHEFASFEMITPAVDTKIHNIIYATELNGTLLLITFNTTVEEAPAWLEIGKHMMRSIKINK